jgi:hypothetical protein
MTYTPPCNDIINDLQGGIKVGNKRQCNITRQAQPHPGILGMDSPPGRSFSSNPQNNVISEAWTPPVNLTLLAVRHPKPMIAGEAMEPWQNTIRGIYTMPRGGVPEAEITIRILEKIIHVKAKPKSMFAKFCSPEAETYKYNARVHCEIVLVALNQFYGGMVGTDVLRDHIRVWFHFSYCPGVYKSDTWHRISTTT